MAKKERRPSRFILQKRVKDGPAWVDGTPEFEKLSEARTATKDLLRISAASARYRIVSIRHEFDVTVFADPAVTFKPAEQEPDNA